MKSNYGKYEGKELGWIVLEDPSYVDWIILNNKMHAKDFEKYVKVFDSLPFRNVQCMGKRGCKNPVKHLSLYGTKYNGDAWFCDECDIYSLGADYGKLLKVDSYAQVARHPQAKDIIRAIATAKGAPQRKTAKALYNFFGM